MLEVVIALGIMGMLVSMIFRVASSAVTLSQTVVDSQQDTMERNAFFRLLTNHFEQIPGNAILRLETHDSYGGSVSRQLFNLTFQNVPTSFNWGENPVTAEAVQLSSVQRRDGFVDVVLRFYDVKILEDPNDPESVDEDAEPFAEITLVEGLWVCDCDVIDGDSLEASSEWDNDSQLPLQVKFYCRFDTQSDIVQQTCWIVPKLNTAQYFRDFERGLTSGDGGQGNQGGGGQGASTRGGENLPSIGGNGGGTQSGGQIGIQVGP